MKKNFLIKGIIGYFFRGLLLVVPITVITYIIYKLFVFLDEIIPTDIPGLGLLILLAGITVLGFLGSTFIAEPIYKRANKILDGFPLLKTIYTAISDLLSAFVGQKKSFSRPVLVKLNRESDIEKPGFVTNDDLTTLNIKTGKIAVYLPHSYNFSGNIFIVPIENVTPVEVNTAEFMKFIVSGGVTDLGKKLDEKS
ncbi:MAG: putative membrane protein [Cryomorphaceae bacterium]